MGKLLLTGGLLIVAAASPAKAVEPVDLQLVLAVDASGSVDPQEYALQLQGIALAFRDPVILKAIEDGPAGKIAVNLLVWADYQEPQSQSGWFAIGTARQAEAFARKVEFFPARRTAPPALATALPRRYAALTATDSPARARLLMSQAMAKKRHRAAP
ncbi:MAG: DUF1194 domain-containing protein [Aestuariivirga sp.]